MIEKFKKLVRGNRSYRRFHEDQPIDRDTLRELVDLARCTASGANYQPLKYALSCEPERNAVVFSCLTWAGYLEDWDGPSEGERPTGYVVVLHDKNLAATPGCDHGIAAQTILLGAAARGLGGCMFGSVNRKRLKTELAIPERCEVLLVIALGKPKEHVVLDETGPDGDIKYWRDAEGVHHVPKRPLDEIVVL